MVQGEASAVEAILHWARRGPPHARVDHVDTEAGDGDYTGFEILY
jgi:acylphosphatase